MLKKWLPALFAILAISLIAACNADNSKKRTADNDANQNVVLPDTLCVATLYSPTSYFIYKEEPMGYEYDMVQKFASDKGIAIKLIVANNLSSMIDMLEKGAVDLVAYDIPFTAEYNDKVLHCGIESITYQVLIQHTDSTIIKDVTELRDKTIHVEKNSKYFHRLQNLNDELGGGIKIEIIDRDSLITNDLVEMVADGKIPLTIVDSDIARISKTYYNNIDASLKISLEQKASWAVNSNCKWLADTINDWAQKIKTKPDYKQIEKRYFEQSKLSMQPQSSTELMIGKGAISPYDALFKKYSTEIGWDWRLLAAQAYVESRFNNNVVSWAGARGLMQLMPRTAAAHGLSSDKITNPDLNIRTAVKVIKSLDKSLSTKIKDKSERQKFVLAAYNSGLAHILDAIAIADKYNKNPHIWNGNVKDAVLMKSRPEYYNDPVCKYGYFRGSQTVEYVDKVINTYQFYRQKIKK